MDERMRPLFIPLRTEHYDAFRSGKKAEELRRYGPRWNESTCIIGRDVILSKGYGSHDRMKGQIWKFQKQHGSLFGSTHKNVIRSIFGTLDIDIACISIKRNVT